MIKKNFKVKNTVQGILSRALILSVLGVFFIAFITSSYLAYKNFQQENLNNEIKTHEILNELISPSLLISDTMEVRRLLGFISTSNNFFGVITQQGNLLFYDYLMNFNTKKFQFNKIKNCTEIQNTFISINDKQYRIHCSQISQKNSGLEKKTLGLLLSFSCANKLIFTSTFFSYFIGIAFLILLLMVLLIKIILHKKLIKPLIDLKNKIIAKTVNPLDGEPYLGNIDSIPEDIENIKSAFESLLINLKLESEKRTEADKKSALYKLAEQVAHDIRSPLAALDMTIRMTSQIPENQRLIIRNATQRITDIANNLLQKNNKKINEHKSVEKTLLMSMLESIISEKRTQYSYQNIEFDFNIIDDAYGAFAEINSIEFKRMISNLVNNACEAIKNHQGKVNVSLSKSINTAIISIQDNGCGIPDNIISQLFSAEISFGKNNGNGLGLKHAHSVMKNCGGEIQITSKNHHGTKVTLSVPLCEAPLWFVSSIEVFSNQEIVVFDDDTSTHNVWNQRLNSIKNIKIHHFLFYDQIKTFILGLDLKLNKYLFLIDYEILHSTETGLDLIKKLNIEKYSILVTSRYEEKSITDNCENLKIKLLPKSMSAYIPIKIKQINTYDAILIDDDSLVHQLWKLSASIKLKTLKTFLNAEDFFNYSRYISRNTPVYIDINLSSELSGYQLSKQICDLGFKKIYFATGLTDINVEIFPHISGVIGKAPPWEIS